MLCEECKKYEANVHFTQLVNGNKIEQKICEKCATKKGFQSNIGAVDNIVSKIIGDSFIDDNDEVLLCKNCGTTYNQFQKYGRLGCSECYKIFEDKLKELLRKIHGSNKHVGKTFVRKDSAPDKNFKIDELKEQLKKAIQTEHFEEAVILRDEIKKLEDI